MYIPQNFAVTDREEILVFIKANSFGQLISLVEGRLFSSHLPFMLSADGQSLICHVAKANPQWQGIEEQEVLVTFQGPHDYISPSWYNTPGVPTWNYQSAHIYGKPELITETKKLKSMVNELSRIYESSLEKPQEPQYEDSLLNVIIGIEINITEIQCKYKLSQNRSASDQSKVIEELEMRDSVQLSQAMRNNRNGMN